MTKPNPHYCAVEAQFRRLSIANTMRLLILLTSFITVHKCSILVAYLRSKRILTVTLQFSFWPDIIIRIVSAENRHSYDNKALQIPIMTTRHYKAQLVALLIQISDQRRGRQCRIEARPLDFLWGISRNRNRKLSQHTVR